MKRFIQESLMLSAIIWIIMTTVSFICFPYQEEMKRNYLIVLLSFLCMGVHYTTAYLFYDSFLKELFWKYACVELLVLVTGVCSGWFLISNWWMSFVYVTPVFVLAYLLGILQIRRDVEAINRKLSEKSTTETSQ